MRTTPEAGIVTYILEHFAFRTCSWSIVHSNILLEHTVFDLEYYSRLFMRQRHMRPEQLVLEQLLLEHNLGQKSNRKRATK